jgi:hypothetical protein
VLIVVVRGTERGDGGEEAVERLLEGRDREAGQRLLQRQHATHALAGSGGRCRDAIQQDGGGGGGGP